jgi:hypothetical protein
VPEPGTRRGACVWQQHCPVYIGSHSGVVDPHAPAARPAYLCVRVVGPKSELHPVPHCASVHPHTSPSPQVQLERRDTLVRDMAGVPRAERPHSASRYLDVATSDTVGFGPEARSSAAAAGAAGGQDAGGQRPRPQSAQSWRSGSMSQRQSLSGGQQRGPSNSGAGSQTPRGMSGAHHTSSLSGTSRGPSVDGRVVTRVRPGSAPASRLQPQQGTGAVAGLPASLLPQPIMEGSGMVGPMAMVRGPEPSTTSTPSSRPTSAVLPRGGLAQAAVAPLQSAGSAVKLVGRSGAPSGQHVQAQGASCASAAAATGGATRWVPPSRSQIESSFLQRLTRAAT